MNRRKILLGLGLTAITVGLTLKSYFVPVKNPALALFLDQTLRYLDGKVYQTKQLHGVPLLINIWAPWCPPCVEELPELSDLFKQLQDTNNIYGLNNATTIKFIAVGVDEPKNIAQFASKTSISFPLLEANSAPIDFIKNLGNHSGVLPFTVLFDENGHIVGQKTGKISSIEVLKWLKKLSTP